jgi:hypothetical protein
MVMSVCHGIPMKVALLKTMMQAAWFLVSSKILFADVKIFWGRSPGPVMRETALSAARATASRFMMTISAVMVCPLLRTPHGPRGN